MFLRAVELAHVRTCGKAFPGKRSTTQNDFTLEKRTVHPKDTVVD